MRQRTANRVLPPVIAAGAVLAALLWVPQPLSAAGAAEPRVSGIVRDAATGDALALANVVIEQTVLGDATDESGRFVILKVPDGTYVVTVSMMGYRTQRETIVLEAGASLQLEFDLERTVLEVSPVVVSASRRARSITDVPVSSNVVPRTEIAKRDVIAPDEVLKFVPGVTMTRSQASIRGSTGFVRGAGSRILLLVDGAPALAGDTGDIKWDIVPTEQIERIEVVKGASSSLYGSSALGGVINIITSPFPETPRTRLRLSAGFYDDPYWPAWKWTSDWMSFGGFDLSHSRRVGPVGILGAVGRKVSDGYRENSDYARTNAMAKVTAEVNASNRLTCLASWALDEYGHTVEWISQSRALEVDPETHDDRVRSEKLAGYLRLHSVLGARTVILSTLNWYANNWRNDFHDATDRSDALKLGGSVQIDRVLGGGWEAILGAEGWRTDVASTMFGDREVGEGGILGEVETRLGEHVTAAGGARYDAYYRDDERTWHSEVSPRASLRIGAGRISAVVAAAEGFRAPTVAELYTSTDVGGYRVKPNPLLRPESAVTYEAGVTGEALCGLMASAGLFRSDYRDLIEPDIDPSDGYLHFVNIRDAVITGLDAWLSAVLLREWITLDLAYMYLSAEDRELDEPLPYRSRHNLKAAIDIRGPAYLIGIDYIYRSRVEEVKVYPDDERVAIKVLDLRGGVAVGRAWLSIKVANLLNYNATQVERNLEPIRSISFTLTTDF